jgi:hypothetical protein
MADRANLGDLEARIRELETQFRGILKPSVAAFSAGDCTNGCTDACTRGCTNGCTGGSCLVDIPDFQERFGK